MSAERVKKILKVLRKVYPDVECALHHENPLQLLVATILSAQCTDKRVNIVTSALFKKYPNAKSFASASLSELEKDIKSTGFYKNKAKAIKNCCHLIVTKHDGKVPQSLEELVKLPGIGRKTANVVLGNLFGIIEGIAVDTHVIRLSQKLGLTKHKDPKKIEQELMKVLPKGDWFDFTNRLICYGREYCSDKNHNHENCPVTKMLLIRQLE